MKSEDILDIWEDHLFFLLDLLGAVDFAQLVQVDLDDELQIAHVLVLHVDEFSKGIT